ncbi:unnamed protein product [Toxocara canis]|uniref:Zinc metalloproteinase n=1 Tax=Toxocara canis TaxID=6265 RepID=A0A183V7S9_TOXCA|nr:unnamed protein product [Toxocara canis]
MANCFVVRGVTSNAYATLHSSAGEPMLWMYHIGTPNARLVLITLLILSPFGFSSSFRVRKASRKTLDRIKRLINQQSERENEKYALGTLADDVIMERKDPSSRPHHDELSGDVDLSEKQAEVLGEILQNANNSDLKDKSANSKSRKKRKIGREPLYVRWNTAKPISYEFADSIPPSTRNKIRAAIALWEQRTCVRFLENGPNVDRIEFFDGGGCSSFVGKTGGTQGISIATPGCDVVGIISHEIGHALGIFHEQARPDQNSHIFVNYNNIPISRWNNFHPVSLNQADTYNLPYDTGSVMHYGAYGFATDPYVPTITTRDKHQQYTIGQREGPSFLDFAAINIAYHCMERCPYMHCDHDGYPNPNDCSECICPDGFAGAMCQFVHYTPCGALITVSTDPIFVASPNYPNLFPVGSQCIWLLKTAVGSKVVLQFVDTFQMQCDDTCDKTYVELKNSGDFRITGYRFCCSKKPTQAFESVTNEMVLIFRAGGDRGLGFKAKVWSNVDTSLVLGPTQSPTTRKWTATDPSTLSMTTTVLKAAISSTPPPPTEPSVTVPAFIRPLTEGRPFIPAPSPTPTEAPLTPPLVGKTGTATKPPSIPSEPGVSECDCGEWSEWTGPCSQECGGCGKRTRRRQCSSDKCRNEDKRACSYRVCPPGTNFLINNGEFHILWKGCCVGLFRSGNECSALEDGQNPFLKILSSLLTSQDAQRNSSVLSVHSHEEKT